MSSKIRVFLLYIGQTKKKPFTVKNWETKQTLFLTTSGNPHIFYPGNILLNKKVQKTKQKKDLFIRSKLYNKSFDNVKYQCNY